MKKIIAALACSVCLSAFADASSWNGVVQILEHDGYSGVAAANLTETAAAAG